MLIIDCDTQFGVYSNGAHDASPDRLIEAEKSDSVDYMLACCLTARNYDALQGNDQTLAASRRHPEILPVATVDPRAHYGVEEEIQRVAGLGFVALRVFPETQGWAIDSLLFARIVDACGKHALPLLVNADGPGKASKIVQMAIGASNPIVLLNANYAVQAEALSALEKRPNTFMSTRFFVTPGVYESAVEFLGADRFVIGTDAPSCGVREVISSVFRSGLDEEDKARILGGNMAGIIAPQLKKLGKSLHQGTLDAYERKCAKTPIIDVHGHLGPWPFAMRNCDAEGLVTLMRRCGIEKCVLSSTNAIVNDFVEGNAELDKAIAGVDGLYGYVTVNPNHLDQSVQEMRKYLDKPKFVGMKMHPGYARISIDSDASRALAQSVACNPAPYLIHTMGPGEPAKIRRLAQEFPDLPIIMAHGGAAAWREALDVVNETENTYLEFCCSTCEFGKVRVAIDQIGTDRILFGTDLGLFDPAHNLGTYEAADLTVAEQQAIMQDNPRRLFAFGD